MFLVSCNQERWINPSLPAVSTHYDNADGSDDPKPVPHA
jgi:hypothetical protein